MHITATAQDIIKFFNDVDPDTEFEFKLKFYRVDAEETPVQDALDYEPSQRASSMSQQVKELAEKKFAEGKEFKLGQIADTNVDWSYQLVYGVVCKMMKDNPYRTEYRRDGGRLIPTGVQYIAPQKKRVEPAIPPKKVSARKYWYDKFSEAE